MIQWWNTKRQWPTICRVNPTWPVDGTALEKGGEKHGQFPQVPVPKKKTLVDGSEIRRSPVEVSYTQTVVVWDFWTINSYESNILGVAPTTTQLRPPLNGRAPRPPRRWTFWGFLLVRDLGPSPMGRTVYFTYHFAYIYPKNPPFMLGKYTIVFRSVMRDVTGFTMGFIWKRCRSTTAWKGTKGTKDIYIIFIVL